MIIMSKRRKKKRSLNISVWIGIILIAVLFIGAAIYQGSQMLSIAGGATIFSVDEVQAYGADENTEWVIALSLNDGAESVMGEFDGDSLQKFNLDVLPDSRFKIEFDLRNPTCEYDIIKDKNIVGELYYSFVTEQCLANVCPYNAIDLDDIIKYCEGGGGSSQIPPVSGKSCDRMIDLIQLGGTYTEWCYWLPEESNFDAPGECRDSTVGRTVTVSNNPAGCGRTLETITTVSMKISEGETGGDWQVMNAGIVPTHNLYRISSAEQFGYDAVVTATMPDTGETFECTINPVTKVCSLGEFGNVKFAGNLFADKGCPDPGNDIMVLRELDGMQWSDVDASTGSSLASYLTSLNKIKHMNIDYFTFTAIPEEVTTTSSSVKGFGCDPAIGNPIFGEITALNSLAHIIPDERPPYLGFECEVVDDNRYVCTTGASVVYPLLKVTVKASKVGIFIPEGKPEIVGMSLNKALALEEDNVETIVVDPNELTRLFIGVKNVGTEDDSFDVSLDCPFPVNQQSVRVVVGDGESEVVSLLVSGDGLIQDCQAKAFSVSYPKNVDVKEVSFIANPSCDQYGISKNEMIFTEYGCYPRINFPVEPCKNNEFWLDSLQRCVPYSEMSTGEQRVTLLESVADEDCNRQCNGNSECTLTCLEQGNVKPVCIGLGEMMTLNDYICDFEDQPNLILPTQLRNKVWVDVPTCDYLCMFGTTGEECEDMSSDFRFDYSLVGSPQKAILVEGNRACETCFDGIANQDEDGVDCGGICEQLYGLDKKCDKLRAPDHCFNHLIDSDEEGRDCGGSCDFECEDVFQSFQPLIFAGKDWTLMILIGVFILGSITVIYFANRKRK